MKVLKRGKYSGAKIHLEPDECEALMSFAKDVDTLKDDLGGNSATNPSIVIPSLKVTSFFSISARIGKKMNQIIIEDPDFLKERTPEQVKESLLADKAKIDKQLAAGGDWKQVD